jgi:hypothetical protein
MDRGGSRLDKTQMPTKETGFTVILHCRSHGSGNPGGLPRSMVSCFESRNRRRAIFRSTRCGEKFIELLSSLPERFGVRPHGYALMGNHYHLQLESREANLSKALHWLNVSYSVWFNRKYSRVGPLFQGRFKAILHEPTEALKISPGSQCELQKAFRQQLREAAAIGRWETD